MRNSISVCCNKLLPFFLILFSMVCGAVAEDRTIAVPDTSFLAKDRIRLQRGWSESQVRTQFGEPDTISKESNGGFVSWRYGESLIAFSNGAVTAWSNNGELSVREYQQQKQHNAQRRDWVQPYDAVDDVTADEVLEELMDDTSPN